MKRKKTGQNSPFAPSNKNLQRWRVWLQSHLKVEVGSGWSDFDRVILAKWTSQSSFQRKIKDLSFLQIFPKVENPVETRLVLRRWVQEKIDGNSMTSAGLKRDGKAVPYTSHLRLSQTTNSRNSIILLILQVYSHLSHLSPLSTRTDDLLIHPWLPRDNAHGRNVCPAVSPVDVAARAVEVEAHKRKMLRASPRVKNEVQHPWEN